MNPRRRGRWVVGLLLGAWLLVAGWQAQEHERVVNAARTDLRARSREIAHTVSAVIQASEFRGTVVQTRLEPVLQRLALDTNGPVKSSKLLSIRLLNISGDAVVSVGQTNLLPVGAPMERESWSNNYAIFVLPVEGATNVVLPPPPQDFTNRPPRDFASRDSLPDGTNEAGTMPPRPDSQAGSPPRPDGQAGPPQNPGDRGPDGRDRPRGPRGRPPWLRWMSEDEFKELVQTHELHGLELAMSADPVLAATTSDLWLRLMIGFFATIATIGAGLAWRNTRRTADLQIRLVRASELNSHLKELNLAAAGLAHETRNPLNIIRGQAQMLSRQASASPEVRENAKTIVDETDKVTAQLTEFINYSRPREVRRTRVALTTVANEIVRTLSLDIEEKKLQVEVAGDGLAVEADEQLLRQALFNLVINAIQATDTGGNIRIVVQRSGPGEAALEVRDTGAGVVPENRLEIFKPYFTTHQKGTGLGLAVVQQICLAHGWEISCLPNEPKGAVFRVTHLKAAN
jgi:signal transduction histidine kinase